MRVEILLLLLLNDSVFFIPPLGIPACRAWQGRLLVGEEDGEGHDDTTNRHVRTLPLAYSSTFPEDTQEAGLVLVQETGCHGSEIGTGTDEQ